MSAPTRGFTAIWPDRRPLLGVVHVRPLPGAPRWSGSMDDVLTRARSDAVALEEAGFDGVVVENFGDAPFYAERVPPATVAAMARVAAAVADATKLPLGLNLLRNDAAAAVSIAVAVGARFVRINVHTGSMWTDQGLVHGRAADTLRLRASLGADVALLADVHVKHATPPPGAVLGASAADAWTRGLADALVVSGGATGAPTDPEDVRTVKRAVPEAVVLVGSGVTEASARGLLEVADGAIVGTAVMEGGRPGGPIDPARAAALVAATR